MLAVVFSFNDNPIMKVLHAYSAVSSCVDI